MKNQVKFIFCVIFLSCFYVFGRCSTCLTALSTVECDCLDNKINCSGTQDVNIDLFSAIENISTVYYASKHLESIEVNVDGLSFSPNLTFCHENVTSMSLSNGLTVIPQDIFICLNESLKNLNLRNNSFLVVPTSGLEILEQLESLDLSYNKLENLTKSELIGLKNLKLLNFTHNNIEHISDETFFYTPNIKELYLDFNNLQHIGSNTFKNLLKLEFLSISSNFIQKFESDAFRDLPSLQILIVDNNNILQFSNLDLQSPSLTKLSAKNCSLHGSIKKETLSNAPELASLDLSHNFLTEVEPFAFSNLKKLNILNLSNNHIKYIRDNAFINLKNLTELNLSKNEIIVVGSSAFYNLTKLKYLNLRENNLTVFIRTYTMDLVSLEDINLENNKLRKIFPGTFLFSPNLRSLKMSGNALECTCDIFEFASFLHNSTTLSPNDTESIMCSSGEKVFQYDFDKLGCIWKITTTEDYDELDDFTSEATVTDTAATNSRDYHSSTKETTTTTETSTVGITNSTPTTTATVTNVTTTTNDHDYYLDANTTTETETTTAATIPKSTSSFTLPNATTEDYEYDEYYESTAEKSSDNFTSTERAITFSPAKSSTVNITVKDYSFSNQNFCIEWFAGGIKFNKSIKCILQYQYESGHSAAYLLCPNSNNTFSQECRKVKVTTMISFCIDIQNTDSKQKLSRFCGDIDKTFSTSEVLITGDSVSTTDSSSTTKDFLDDVTNLTTLLPAASKSHIDNVTSTNFVIYSSSVEENLTIFTTTEITLDTSDIIIINESATALLSAVSSQPPSQSFSVIVLLGILIAVICVIIIILIRTHYRKNIGSVQYNVSKEEQKIQKRSKSINRAEHSVRYSYTVNENADLL